MNPLLWFAARQLIRFRRGRTPPRRLPDPIWYFAYGSNMNERLFRERRHMTPIATRIGRLADHRLVFTVAGGMRPGLSAPANIVDAPGRSVHGVLYQLPLHQFARLDNSEGRQYDYLWTGVEDGAGQRVSAVTYKVPQAVIEGKPGRRYFAMIREAALQRDLPADYIAMLDQIETRD